jgi:hypothetical protein
LSRINKSAHPLPATIAGNLRPLAWADSDVQDFRPLANRNDDRLASLTGAVPGALLFSH